MISKKIKYLFKSKCHCVLIYQESAISNTCHPESEKESIIILSI